MSWISNFSTLLADTVVVTALSGVSTDGYGIEQFATSGTTYSARVVREQKLVRTFAGIEEVSSMTIWVASTTTFSPMSKISLSGSTLGPLMSLEAYPDEDGVQFLKAYFG